ncbi:hypothetical protein COLO4_03934 [Corchorus olitorius]|uniref:Reverse transcriptase RNase H-like domain-containing protein n=1 Tax=Corchorus olitorius TaxID=93759 RepID=A0A1R3KVV1_9ROSI|nr:hypothetical protein COLO4_03934 [Corchorus olitorius]
MVGKSPSFFSRTLGIRYQKLAVYEKELIGLAKGIRHWRPYPYLSARLFKVRTDHFGLKSLLDKIRPMQEPNERALQAALPFFTHGLRARDRRRRTVFSFSTGANLSLVGEAGFEFILYDTYALH